MTKCFHIVNGKHFRNFVGERAGRAAKLLTTLASAKKNGTLEGDTRPAHAPPTPRAQKKGEEKERKDIWDPLHQHDMRLAGQSSKCLGFKRLF